MSATARFDLDESFCGPNVADGLQGKVHRLLHQLAETAPVEQDAPLSDEKGDGDGDAQLTDDVSDGAKAPTRPKGRRKAKPKAKP